MTGPTIGNLQLANPLVLAPLCDHSTIPLRRMCYEYGAALCHIPMVLCDAYAWNNLRTLDLIRIHRSESPIGIQVCGKDPASFGKAAADLAGRGYHLLDINIACPAKKIVRRGRGGGMLRHWDLMAECLRAAVEAASIPVTAKIRGGYCEDDTTYLDVGRLCEKVGIDAITLHPRTVAQGYSGRADWSMIGRLKREVSIPVFGSGDVRHWSAPARMLRETGCDGVSIARGAIGSPWIFKQALEHLATGKRPAPVTLGERKRALRRHMDLMVETFGEARACVQFRKFVVYYSKQLPWHKEMRVALGKVETLEEFNAKIDDFFARLPEDADPEEVDESLRLQTEKSISMNNDH